MTTDTLVPLLVALRDGSVDPEVVAAARASLRACADVPDDLRAALDDDDDIAGTAGALLVLWTLVKVGGELEPEVFRGGLLGLVAATAAHAGGIVFGAALAPAKGSNAAYLASMLVRFVLTPVLAVSLYFLLPVKPQPVLIGAAAGYLVILFADVATVMTGLKSASSGSVGRASR